MTFGKLLKTFRANCQWTQAELARRLDMDVAYLSRMENDITGNPSRGTIERLASAMYLLKPQSDQLHLLAGRIPADVEAAILANPKLLAKIRKGSE